MIIFMSFIWIIVLLYEYDKKYTYCTTCMPHWVIDIQKKILKEKKKKKKGKISKNEKNYFFSKLQPCHMKQLD